MVVVSYNFEVTSSVARPGFSRPLLLKQLSKSVELEGDASAGSIVKINFVEGDKLEKNSYENQFVAAADGGSIYKSSMKYYTISDYVITEDEIKTLIKGSEVVHKAIEAYLVANPDACN
ncbi:hypothetical protein CXB51_025499 [Gossypium anomalum]|uniref:Bet v I/Major latex protein domain-containing protein n=1 Tax=Gossypium anomalum TaxID=47600 RepID=A0A8J5YE66_9ROSI|nr:hypothetical protein CXB51_025499 [Gossypium anomalum]